MKITREERQFLKKNKKILSEIFTKRLNELTNRVLAMEVQDISRDDIKSEIRFIQEMKAWLRDLSIFSKKKKVKTNQNLI